MIASDYTELVTLSERQRPALVKELHLLTDTDALQLLEQLRAEACNGDGGRRYE